MFDKTKIVLATKKDILPAKELYRVRAKWLKDKGVVQWRRSEQIHSIEYLNSQQELGQMYVCRLDDKIIGSFCLQTKDKFWETDENAIYLHAFVSSIKHNGYGKFMINEMKKICKQKSKKYLRLDCRADNKKLNEFYDKNGFKVIEQKVYSHGAVANLRELKIG